MGRQTIRASVKTKDPAVLFASMVLELFLLPNAARTSPSYSLFFSVAPKWSATTPFTAEPGMQGQFVTFSRAIGRSM